jgi:hypothetical protein
VIALTSASRPISLMTVVADVSEHSRHVADDRAIACPHGCEVKPAAFARVPPGEQQVSHAAGLTGAADGDCQEPLQHGLPIGAHGCVTRVRIFQKFAAAAAISSRFSGVFSSPSRPGHSGRGIISTEGGKITEVLCNELDVTDCDEQAPEKIVEHIFAGAG